MSNVKHKDAYQSLIDEEILPYIQEGDVAAVEYMLNKYERMVHKKANGYFLMGSDRDDVVQEGRIGLFKAIADYDHNKKASFKSFAELCITRQIITSVKSATRLKHTPLNSYISIYRPANEEDDTSMLIETLTNEKGVDPLQQIINKEEAEQLKSDFMKALTRLEWEVLELFLNGFTYVEIAEKLNRHEKSIDNALQRVRRKIEKMREEIDR